MKIQHLLFSLIVMMIVTACAPKASTSLDTGNTDESAMQLATKKMVKPLNVILLIGDGMGVSQISTRYYYPDGPINFERFKHIGLINTSSASDVITDSAAGGTAFASGVRTYNAAIGVNADTTFVPTILEELSELGYKSGLVTTSSMTHATPACFFAHATTRHQHELISGQMVGSDVDFFAGGGRKYFMDRSDNRNIISELQDDGFVMNTELILPFMESINPDKKYGFLNADNGLPKMSEGRGDYLPRATSMAIDYLSQNDKGFFLMVEGAQIDWGGHAKDSEYIIRETVDFDVTIGKALDFAEKDGNTLVIATADHETGGYALSGREKEGGGIDYNSIEPKFTSSGHSACLVPVFAYGPGSEHFNGMYLNTGIYDRIKAACMKKNISAN